MESPTNGSGRRPSAMTMPPGATPKPGRQGTASALVVTDIVRHGMGRGSRVDLTILFAGHRVRLTGLPARHVLSYSRIEKASVEEGVVLPYFRFADRTWRKVLAPAMEQARIEPSLEGEEIADAIVAEIRALLEGWNRGDRASDLMSGKVVEQGDRWLVSPKTLIRAVRNRLVDDVLPQAAIAEAATAHLGMRQSRPRFSDAGTRPCAWAFPRTALTSRPNRDGAPSPLELENSKPEREAADPDTEQVPSMDGGAAPVSPMQTDPYSLDRLDGEKCDSPQDPVHGRPVLEGISQLDKEMASGSNGREELGDESERSGTSGRNSRSAAGVPA